MNTPLSFSVHALAQAVEQCPASVVITDLNGNIQYVNPWFTKVTGYHRDEVLGGNPRVLKSGYTTTEEYAEMFRHLEAGRIWRGEFKNKRKNGEHYWEEAVIVPVTEPDGRIIHYLALKEDVTARREAERAREGLIGLLHFCNRAHSRAEFLQGAVDYLRAFTEVEAVRVQVGEGTPKRGHTLFVSGRGDSPDDRQRAVVVALVQGDQRLGRLEFIPAAGQVPSRGQSLQWEELAETVAVTLARHNSEEALRESEQRYRDVQKMEAVGQLAGGVAHDFNNILTATLLHLALLREVPGLPNRVVTTLEELEVEAKRAVKLNRQLLLCSRRSLGKVERVDLGAVIGGLHSLLKRALGEQVTLDFPAAVRGAWVDADVGMMEQLITNLCVNARDAMEPHGGRLSVRIEPVMLDSSAVERSARAKSGRFVCIRVVDTGCGMDAATRTRLFEPFFSTKAEGTGLGLAAVYGIVERHFGWIEVDSVVGQGTEFRVYLPAQEPPQAGATGEPAAPLPLARGERILLVEDDPVVRATAASVLRLQGYKVFDVADGPVARTVWAREGGNFQLLLTDLVLPGGLTGRDLILLCRETRPHLPVVVVTGYAGRHQGFDLSDLSELDVVRKPFELAELAKVVARRLGRVDEAS